MLDKVRAIIGVLKNTLYGATVNIINTHTKKNQK